MVVVGARVNTKEGQATLPILVYLVAKPKAAIPAYHKTLFKMCSGVKCITVYNRPDKVGDCPRIRFDCEALNLRNRDPVPWRCNKGDKLIIYKHYDGDVYYPTRK